MSLANLFNVPSTLEEWSVWSFSHVDHHRQIIRTMREKYEIRLPEFILDPIPFHALDGWLWSHQQMHNDMDTPLAIGGFDLTGLDLDNEGQVAAWIRLHATDHARAADRLDI